MFVNKLQDCREFIAGDGSLLRELLHAEKGEFSFRYSLAHAKVKKGEETKPHKLKTSEVYYILEGRGIMRIEEESFEVGPGTVIYIPPGARQYIKNTQDSDLFFLCIVDPAWRPEDEIVN